MFTTQDNGLYRESTNEEKIDYLFERLKLIQENVVYKDVHFDFSKEYMDKQVKKTKELRVKLDGNLQELKDLFKGYNNEDTLAMNMAEIKIKEAIMWLGMKLKALETPNPYPNSYNPDNNIIDKTDDNLKF